MHVGTPCFRSIQLLATLFLALIFLILSTSQEANAPSCLRPQVRASLLGLPCVLANALLVRYYGGRIFFSYLDPSTDAGNPSREFRGLGLTLADNLRPRVRRNVKLSNC